MEHVVMEIKARCSDPDSVRRTLQDRSARRIGTDRQTDTYFRVDSGRLKLREGQIENALIHYERPDYDGPKQSNVLLYHPEPGSALKAILSKALGVDVVVEKLREIFYVDNVKCHVDDVARLGTFVEIEAIADVEAVVVDGALADESQSENRTAMVNALRRQCTEFMQSFGIREEDLLSSSYCDMVRELH